MRIYVQKCCIKVSNEMRGPILFPFISSSRRPLVKIRTSYCCCHTAGDGGSKGGRGGTSQVTLGTNRFLAAPTIQTSSLQRCTACPDCPHHCVGHFPRSSTEPLMAPYQADTARENPPEAREAGCN